MNIRQTASNKTSDGRFNHNNADAGFADQDTVRHAFKGQKGKGQDRTWSVPFVKVFCGNTSDYDINNIRAADEDIRFFKVLILSLSKELQFMLFLPW